MSPSSINPISPTNSIQPANPMPPINSATSTNPMPLRLDFPNTSHFMHSPFFPDHLRQMGIYLDEAAIIKQMLEPAFVAPSHRIFTLYELEHYYNGQNGAPAYVSANGFVFDVTHSPAWANGRHFSLTPGHDYSSLFTIYHCNDISEMSTHVPVLGRIVYA